MRSNRYNVPVLPPRPRVVASAAGLVLVVLSLGGSALGATSSGANGDIAFVRGADFYLLSTGNVIVSGASDPSWSPDGTKLAFVQSGAIKTCVVAGCSPLPTGATGTEPAWSPDGLKLAYVSGGNIHVWTLASNTDLQLTSAGTNADPSWSPDGTQIAFTQNGVIATMSSATPGSGTAIPTNGISSGTSQPSWSPDGATIAFQSAAGGSFQQIYVVSASGGAVTPVTSTTEDETAPSWSPDGTKLAFAQTSGTGVLYQVTQGVGGTWGALELRDANAGDATPDWQTIAPVAISAPSISGNFAPQTGQLLSTTNGGWSGANSGGYTYQWRRCDSAGNNCADIGGATDSTYAVASADVGNTLRVVVTASNAAGQTPSAPSNATGVVTLAGVVNPPSNAAPPGISLPIGETVPMVGDFVSATAGTWTGSFPMTFAYQWVKCPAADPLNGPCFSIPGATSSFFTIPPSLYGMRFRVVVTATNSAGSAHQSSAASEIVSAIPPRLTVTPPILGQNIVDQILSVGTGVWEGSTPLTYTYEWRRCDPVGTLASCVAIPGAVTSTYTAQVADIGFSLRVYITASNPAGSATGATNHTYPVVDKQHFAPTTTDPPSIAGTLTVGRQLTATIGTFGGDTPIATSFVWQRCDATGMSCHSIPHATKVVYSPTDADRSSTLRLSVTAKNAYGTLHVQSDPSEAVLAAPPRHKGRRIVGTNRGDYLAGGGYDDVILGRGGNDTLLGGAGDDRLVGGAGNDVLIGGPGADVLLGGPGSDTIYAADGERDIVDCGPGRDRAVVDAVDIVKNCEVVQIVSASSSSSGSILPGPTP